MKIRYIAPAALALGLMACETEGADVETDSGMAVDTVVTERTLQDTALVQYDTTIDVDTSMDRGDQRVGPRDTVLDTRPQP